MSDADMERTVLVENVQKCAKLLLGVIGSRIFLPLSLFRPHQKYKYGKFHQGPTQRSIPPGPDKLNDDDAPHKPSKPSKPSVLFVVVIRDNS